MTDKCPKCRAVEVSSFNKNTTFLCCTTTWKGTVKDETQQCLRNQIIQRDTRIAELEAIVDKLPKTADGVPVAVGQEVFVIVNDEVIDDGTQKGGIAGACASWYVNPGGNFYDAMVDWKSGYRRPLSDCYSTREAAEQARDGEVGTEALRGDDEN